MAEKNKREVYTEVYLKALGEAAGEIGGLMDELGSGIREEKAGYIKIRATVDQMSGIGSGSDPGLVQQQLKTLQKDVAGFLEHPEIAGMEERNMSVRMAKALDVFAKTQEKALGKCMGNTKELEKPAEEQIRKRVKVSFDTLQTEVRRPESRERHSRVNVQNAEKTSAKTGNTRAK